LANPNSFNRYRKKEETANRKIKTLQVLTLDKVQIKRFINDILILQYEIDYYKLLYLGLRSNYE